MLGLLRHKEGANLTERLWNDGLTLLVSLGA